MPVVVVGWWLAELQALLMGSDRVSCDFMDGPFGIEVRRVEDSWVISPYREDSPLSFQKAVVSPQECCASMLGASQEILVACATNAWKSHAIESLSRASAKLLSMGLPDSRAR
jgi:hypothetical protein